MATFLYRCPATNLTVQGLVADDPDDGDAYQPLTCLACRQIHLVNPTTGKVLAAAAD